MDFFLNCARIIFVVLLRISSVFGVGSELESERKENVCNSKGLREAKL